MKQTYPPISPKIPRLLHGADYNPEQWQQYPDVLAEDVRLMQLARCNVMSVGIFAWSALEPAEGTCPGSIRWSVVQHAGAAGTQARQLSLA